MQKLHNKGIIKKLIICIITAIMLCNFAVPNFAYASIFPDEGGLIFKAIAQFVTYLGDKTMEWLQNTFTSIDKIEQEDGTYIFKYSPAIIFSGKVPALDINFINPSSISIHETADNLQDKIDEIYFSTWTYLQNWRSKGKTGDTDYKEDYEKAKNDAQYTHVSGSYPYMGGDTVDYDAYYLVNVEKNELYICCRYDRTSDVYYSGVESLIMDVNYESTAGKLQSTIASWYKALRRVALVGLLSVLVYLGIRIVLSSNSPESQSKYKKMLTDWLVAVCLLFTLHYIMSFTLTIAQEISNIFNTGTSDELLNTLRGKIKNGGSWGLVASELIMYITLVILTITYTIQYLKRVIYMAFFTMIAPLISLTYPLDKIKDGQAQAFTMWLREYIFNALIQVVHLVIYYVLVGSALDLVDTYPLYAIVALLFIKKAEGIIKKMFGFDKSETVSAIGAATTGALVMNAVNSLKRLPKGSKQGAESGSGTGKGVRTANVDPLQGLTAAGVLAEGNGTPTQTGGNGAPAGAQNGSGTPAGAQNGNGAGAQAGTITGARTPSGAGTGNPLGSQNPTEQNKKDKEKVRALRGARTLLERYGRPVLSKAGGIVLGGTGALIGFSAGVAQGDIGKALGGVAAGAGAGYHGGQRLVNSGLNAAKSAAHIGDKWNNVKDAYNEGARGREYVAQEQFDREFFKSDEYLRFRDEHQGVAKEDISTMLAAGITDTKSMEKIINSGGNLEEEIGYYTLAKDCDNSTYYGKGNKLREYLAGKLKRDDPNTIDVDYFYNKMRNYK